MHDDYDYEQYPIHLAHHRPHALSEHVAARSAREGEMLRLLALSGCFYGRFSAPGDETYPPCRKPAAWKSPMTGMTWCDDHKHIHDVRL